MVELGSAEYPRLGRAATASGAGPLSLPSGRSARVPAAELEGGCHLWQRRRFGKTASDPGRSTRGGRVGICDSPGFTSTRITFALTQRSWPTAARTTSTEGSLRARMSSHNRLRPGVSGGNCGQTAVGQRLTSERCPTHLSATASHLVACDTPPGDGRSVIGAFVWFGAIATHCTFRYALGRE